MPGTLRTLRRLDPNSCSGMKLLDSGGDVDNSQESVVTEWSCRSMMSAIRFQNTMALRRPGGGPVPCFATPGLDSVYTPVFESYVHEARMDVFCLMPPCETHHGANVSICQHADDGPRIDTNRIAPGRNRAR